MIPPAAATGRLTMIANAMAREIVMGANGKVEAVSYIDKSTKSEQRVYAKSVVVAASACESARLLLNSRSQSFLAGLANSSGVIGRYLTDSVGSDLTGYFPQLENMPVHNHDGVGGMHMYMPWWRFGKKNEFLRGYHIEFGGGRDMPGVGGFDYVCEEQEGYGASLKRKCRSSYGTFIGFSGRGEMIPNENSFCELDPEVKDKWGIPVLRFHWQWGENETRMAADMQQTFRSIIEAAGGTVIGGTRRHPQKSSADASNALEQQPSGRISEGGAIIHELGTVRMGSDSKTSALNKNCQAHDVKNLFVADAAPFVTNPDKNPTLTIMALAWKTSEYLLDQAKKGEL
jgi:choline dehydrogenase-like flavoprotein